MQRYNMQNFVRVTVFLVLANALLADDNLEDRKRSGRSLVADLRMLPNLCNETRYYTPNCTEAKCKGCFIYELEKIGKNCTNGTNAKIENEISIIQYYANIVFENPPSRKSSCQEYKLEPFQTYKRKFLKLVQCVNAMASAVGS